MEGESGVLPRKELEKPRARAVFTRHCVTAPSKMLPRHAWNVLAILRHDEGDHKPLPFTHQAYGPLERTSLI